MSMSSFEYNYGYIKIDYIKYAYMSYECRFIYIYDYIINILKFSHITKKLFPTFFRLKELGLYFSYYKNNTGSF